MKSAIRAINLKLQLGYQFIGERITNSYNFLVFRNVTHFFLSCRIMYTAKRYSLLFLFPGVCFRLIWYSIRNQFPPWVVSFKGAIETIKILSQAWKYFLVIPKCNSFKQRKQLQLLIINFASTAILSTCPGKEQFFI